MCDVCGASEKPKITKFKRHNGAQSWYYHCLICDVNYVDDALARLNKLERYFSRVGKENNNG